MDQASALLRSGNWTAVAGLFDPLTLAQAERVAGVAKNGCRTLAVVIPGSDTLLPSDARAALIASLRNVDAVVIAGSEQMRAAGLSVDEDASADRERSAEFVNFVLQR
ncbi:MAG: hypothetical protein M3Y72_20815 [Acidobacteriota bacterium]|nr:hypothetical protein [Acidobacteriota bacterium]